jgi:hypothetical protein
MGSFQGNVAMINDNIFLYRPYDVLWAHMNPTNVKDAALTIRINEVYGEIIRGRSQMYFHKQGDFIDCRKVEIFDKFGNDVLNEEKGFFHSGVENLCDALRERFPDKQELFKSIKINCIGMIWSIESKAEGVSSSMMVTASLVAVFFYLSAMNFS